MTLPSAGSQLCLACGICCMGIFFDNAEIAQEFGVDDGWSGAAAGDPLLPLACSFYREERCVVYHHPNRPPACPEYRCELLKKMDAGEIGLDQGRLIVVNIKSAFSKLIERLPRAGEMNPAYHLVRNTLYSLQMKRAAGDRSDLELLMDILSFMRLLYQYILPAEDR